MSVGRPPSQLRLPLLVLLFVLAIVIAAGVVGQNAHREGVVPDRLRISTASKGGTYDVIGRGLANLLEFDPEPRVQEVSAHKSKGSRDNVERLLRPRSHRPPARGTLRFSTSPFAFPTDADPVFTTGQTVYALVGTEGLWRKAEQSATETTTVEAVLLEGENELARSAVRPSSPGSAGTTFVLEVVPDPATATQYNSAFPAALAGLAVGRHRLQVRLESGDATADPLAVAEITYDVSEETRERLREIAQKIKKAAENESTAGEGEERYDPYLAADLAIMSSAILHAASDEAKRDIRTLARLYDDYMQVVVRRDADLTSLADLGDRPIYIGADKSGTEPIARRILEAAGVRSLNRVCKNCGFADVAELLLEDSSKVDVAVFGGGLPTAAVRRLLDTGRFELLDLGEEVAAKAAALVPGASTKTIGRDFYRNQRFDVSTITLPALLVCRADLHEDLTEWVLHALFDNLDGLLARTLSDEKAAGSVAVEEIRFDDAFPEGVGTYHSGALRFHDREAQKLVIVTGSLLGRYYDIGVRIRMLLEQAGIRARVAHTDGSLENAARLREEPLLAIVQYDVALAASWGNPRAVYKMDWAREDALPLPKLSSLRTIARLHEEQMHVLVRQDARTKGRPVTGTVEDLEGLRVCVGPEHSGTRALADAVLRHSDPEGKGDPAPQLEPTGVVPEQTVYLRVRDMTDRLVKGDIDAGFYVTAFPSTALESLLEEDSGLTMLGVDPKQVAALTSTSALDPAVFRHDSPNAYGCLDRNVHTLATRAILVTRDDMEDVERITRAIFQGAGFLGIDGDEDLGLEGVERSMAVILPSLDPHPDALKVYEERGLRPKPVNRLLETIAAIVTSLAVMVGGYRGLQLLREEHLTETIRGEVLHVSLAATNEDAVKELKTHLVDVRRRAQRRWWQRGALSNVRCNRLEAMIEDRIQKARDELSRALIREARAIRHGNDYETLEKREELRRRVWEHVADGELSELQVLLVLRASGEGTG